MRKLMAASGFISVVTFVLILVKAVVEGTLLNDWGYVCALGWALIFLIWFWADYRETPHWISTKKRLPSIDYLNAYREEWDEDPEFLVMIAGGVVPTCLYFDGKEWYEQGEFITYTVTHWMEKPAAPGGIDNA